MSLFDRHLNPLSPAFLVVLVLAGIAVPAGRAAAQENVVMIQVVGPAGNQELKIMNRGVGICKNPTTDCFNTIEWKWTTNAGNVASKVIIELVAGTKDAYKCLTLGGEAKVRFQLTSTTGAGSTVTATVGPLCPPKSAWIYEVRCEKSDKSACAPPIDPGVIIR